MRVLVHPLADNKGNKFRVKYNGILSKNGAEQVYLHAGLGYNGSWAAIKDIAMKDINGEWVADIRVEDRINKFNFCFRDSADHWDNNSGNDWSYRIL
ncbi:carbohydrate-binding protein [Orenia marismortui]|uniref:Putative carbohydrate-binding protein with starch-binding CBM53 n=1 Tax=Orenia marismortui TaxID=46469 RepID=A0A4R8GGW2_9FIRM|nr:carbohydrate-binding protein [Orenia marismortui]TDX44485.1 putative carbohydrate-binding protein with starch-binding CBM53 [Orenia marismortui]